MTTHKLKIRPEYFEVVTTPDRSKRKAFEIRRNYRNYQVGDTLQLREYDPNSEEFTGRSTERLVTYIAEGPPFMPEGWVVMSLAEMPGGGVG